MAAAEPAPRRIYLQRSKLTSLPLYYEGFLWIKQGRNKVLAYRQYAGQKVKMMQNGSPFILRIMWLPTLGTTPIRREVKYWTELRGTKLFLYTDKKQEKFTDSIDLKYLSSVTDKYPSQTQWTEVILQFPNEEVYIKTETAEVAEEWKGFILTVSQLSVPTSLTLLPGQIIQLKEVLEKESSRRASGSFEDVITSPCTLSPTFPSTYEDVENVNSMPTCFYAVTRQQATEMLMKDQNDGNLILRPGADCKNFAVTIREPTENSTRPQVKHYKVLKTDHGFTIELDRPITLQKSDDRFPLIDDGDRNILLRRRTSVVLSSLDEVVNHFINETRGKLRPFISSIYDTQIDYTVKETNDDTRRKSQSKIQLLINQLSQERPISVQRGSENAYVNVFPK